MSKTITSSGSKKDIRKVYGKALAELAKNNDKIVVLDAETSNSTGADQFKLSFPNKFVECFIAEQNMIGVATGLSVNGYLPFVSSFGAFFTRGFDQIRMAGYGNLKINFVGTHIGSSIGMDGVSQMALEDIALFGSILHSQIFCPADEVSYKKILKLMVDNNKGVNYCRTTRGAMREIYREDEKFIVGGSHTIYKNHNGIEEVAIVANGFTLEESIKAADKLKDKININVIDLYSIKPINRLILKNNIGSARKVLVVEDHYKHGGVGSIVTDILKNENYKISGLYVKEIPRSGTKEDIYKFVGLDSDSIVKKIKESFPDASKKISL